MARRLLTLAVLIAAAGCGDDPCQPASSELPTAGFIQSRADLPTEGCDSSLKGETPYGDWFVIRSNREPFGGSGPVRIEGECGAPPNVVVGRIGRVDGYQTFVREDGEWIWHQFLVTENGFIERAYLICGQNDDGSYRGHYKRCFQFDDFERCDDEPVTMSPYGNIEGEPEAEGVELVAEYRGEGEGWPAAFAANVRVKDGIAYFVNGTDGLRIVDVSDLEAPFEIGFLEAESDFFNDVKLTTDPEGKQYALIASDVLGVLSVDVSDPQNPEVVAIFTPSGDPMHGVHTLYLDTFEGAPAAFIVDGFSGVLGVYDITDPALPVRVGEYNLGDEPAFHDLYVENGLIYLNATVGGMHIVDPSLPEPVLGIFDSGDYSHSNWVTTGGGRKISVHGGEGFDAGIQIVDVDPESPQYLQTVGEYQTREQVSAHNIQAFGERAFIAYYEDGLRILDLSDPQSPVQIGHFNSWSPDNWDGSYLSGMAGIDVHPDDGLVFASDSQRGLLILRLTLDD
ncbi:MAG: hypothetical protein KJO07_06815 [Deltaproteobacteria bacterium]|nr:hypothetical protein [Deltaproteobacteria bacterium]